MVESRRWNCYRGIGAAVPLHNNGTAMPVDSQTLVGKILPFPLTELLCTHKSSDLASTGFDPPLTPLKKGGNRI